MLDIHQVPVARCFSELRRQIDQEKSSTQVFRWLAQVFNRGPSSTRINGLYVWGGVGRGKTMLMDEFFNHVQSEQKRRLHFHQFMQSTHRGLAEFTRVQDPMERLTEQLAETVKLLCLDEFFVADIGDAMIFDQLLQNLLKHEIILVTTSNVPPADLYLDGLQRRRFLPAIRLLEQEFRVVRLAGKCDYRLKTFRNQLLYRIGTQASAEMCERDCQIFASGGEVKPVTIEANDHPLHLLFSCGAVAAITFEELCIRPRSAADYLEIAKLYQTVLIYEVPQLTAADEEPAKRFINLIDVFYDHVVNVVIQASVDVAELYVGVLHQSIFERTASRLREMMSKEYLAKAHQL